MRTVCAFFTLLSASFFSFILLTDMNDVSDAEKNAEIMSIAPRSTRLVSMETIFSHP